MVAVPISSTTPGQLLPVSSISPATPATGDFAHFIAAGAVIAGGALMIAGHKKAGLAVAAAGTVLGLFEEPAAVESWWKHLPSYLARAQSFLDQVEGHMQDAATRGHRLQSLFRR